MPWYKLTNHHGPGHMGEEIKYQYSEETLSDSAREDMWEEWVSLNYWDDNIGTAELVLELPPYAYRELVDDYAVQIEQAIYMQDILSHTKVGPECVHPETRLLRWFHKYTMCDNEEKTCYRRGTHVVMCRECDETVLVRDLCDECIPDEYRERTSHYHAILMVNDEAVMSATGYTDLDKAWDFAARLGTHNDYEFSIAVCENACSVDTAASL